MSRPLLPAPPKDAQSAATPDAGRKQACAQCRERKIKCDGTKPDCSRCARQGHQCHYLPPAKRIGKGEYAAMFDIMSQKLQRAETAAAAAHDSTRMEDNFHMASITPSYVDHRTRPVACVNSGSFVPSIAATGALDKAGDSNAEITWSDTPLDWSMLQVPSGSDNTTYDAPFGGKKRPLDFETFNKCMNISAMNQPKTNGDAEITNFPDMRSDRHDSPDTGSLEEQILFYTVHKLRDVAVNPTENANAAELAETLRSLRRRLSKTALPCLPEWYLTIHFLMCLPSKTGYEALLRATREQGVLDFGSEGIFDKVVSIAVAEEKRIKLGGV